MNAEKQRIKLEVSRTTQRKTRVAAYCRVSTGSQNQESSIAAQRRHYEDYIRSNPCWEYAGVYWEAGVAGTNTGNRPELNRLFADCGKHRIDLVLTKSISRFSRNTADCLEMVRDLSSMGVGIYFQKENIDTSTMDSEFLLALLSSIAEEESRSISDNSKWAVQKRFANGTFKYSKAPYGYDLRDGTFTVNPEQAPIVKEIFRRVPEGDSAAVIAGDLNSRHIPTGTKRRDGSDGIWTASMILGMLRNVTYTGDVLMQKTYSGRDYRRHKNTGQVTQYYNDGHHEGIIDHDSFRLAGETLDMRRKGTDRSSCGGDRGPRVFSGHLTCGLCGGSMKRITGKVRDGKRYYWGCSGHQKSPEACSMKRELEENIRNAFCTMLNKLAFAPVIDLYIEMLNKEEKEKADLESAALLEKEKELMREKERLTLLLCKGCGEQVYYIRRNSSIEAEEAAIRKELQLLGEKSVSMQESENTKMLVSRWKTGQERDIALLFNQIVRNASVLTGESVTFNLMCGLVLNESLERPLPEKELFLFSPESAVLTDAAGSASSIYKMITSSSAGREDASAEEIAIMKKMAAERSSKWQ